MKEQHFVGFWAISNTANEIFATRLLITRPSELGLHLEMSGQLIMIGCGLHHAGAGTRGVNPLTTHSRHTSVQGWMKVKVEHGSNSRVVKIKNILLKLLQTKQLSWGVVNDTTSQLQYKVLGLNLPSRFGFSEWCFHILSMPAWVTSEYSQSSSHGSIYCDNKPEGLKGGGKTFLRLL